jgi:hypothetical protein
VERQHKNTWKWRWKDNTRRRGGGKTTQEHMEVERRHKKTCLAMELKLSAATTAIRELKFLSVASCLATGASQQEAHSHTTFNEELNHLDSLFL